tara:strand:+ start:1149 stop:2804 length:1656 start_codon:yes stop_codon:yes gene_type:complete
MAQHDYVIDNSTGANVRADINNVLQAIATNNSGSSDPSTTLASQFFADTNAGIMKLRNTANNGYVNLFNLAGGINVDANSNFSGDVAFDGVGDQNILFDKSASAFIFNDNAKAQFGTDSDLKVYHTGTHGYVQNETGNLYLTAKSNEDGIIVRPDAQTELYFDNSLKFQTLSSGAEVSGHLHLADNNEIRLGNVGSGGDFKLKHDGSNSFIIDGGGSSGTVMQAPLLAVKNAGGTENMLVATQNGNVELMFDNTKRIETNNSGAFVTGELGCDTLYMGDNEKVKLGNSDDIQIFHESSSNDNIIDCATTRPLRIRFGGSNQFEFFSSGGFKMNDGRKIVLGDSTDFTLFHDGAVGNIIDCRNAKSFFLVNDTGGGNETMIQADPNSVVRLFSDGVQKFITNSFGVQILNDQKILFKKETSTSGSIQCIDFDKDNPTNNVGDISMDNSSVSYNTGSDYRLKENEKPIDDAIEKVKLLKPYYFNFIETPEKLSQGFYAHEVSDIVPTAVKGEKDQVALNGMPIYQKLDYSKIVPMLAAGLKALIEKVEKLEAA